MLKLGIVGTNEEIEIIRVLSDTNFRLTTNLCLVSPDDIDELFKTKK